MIPKRIVVADMNNQRADPRGTGYSGIKIPSERDLGHLGDEDNFEEAVQFEFEFGLSLKDPMPIKDATFTFNR